jgi:hypothetical protein
VTWTGSIPALCDSQNSVETELTAVLQLTWIRRWQPLYLYRHAGTDALTSCWALGYHLRSLGALHPGNEPPLQNSSLGGSQGQSTRCGWDINLFPMTEPNPGSPVRCLIIIVTVTVRLQISSKCRNKLQTGRGQTVRHRHSNWDPPETGNRVTTWARFIGELTKQLTGRL